MKTQTKLLLNTAASGFVRTSAMVIRLVQVPLLLATLGSKEEYGRWLLLSSLPAWLNLANLGLGSSACNEVVLAAAGGDLRKARIVFSTGIALLGLIAGLGAVLTFVIAPFIPWERFLGVPAARHTELSLAIIWLAFSVLTSLLLPLYGAKYVAGHKAHQGMVLGAIRFWTEFACMLIALHFSTRFDALALAIFLNALFFFVSYRWLGNRAMPDTGFSIALVNTEHLSSLFRVGMAFQAFPLGNALLFQGNLLVIQAILGPAAVAVFGTARTLARSINQFMELVNVAFGPEMGQALGARLMAKAARLHRLSVGISFSGAVIGTLALAAFGNFLFNFWTRKAIPLPEHLLLLFLVPVPFNALWCTSMVVHNSCNKIHGAAVRYLAANVITIVACAVLSKYFGVEGAALSTLLGELIMIPYVLRQSLALTGDSWHGFVSGLVWEPYSAYCALIRQ